jgi:hypothetical protein
MAGVVPTLQDVIEAVCERFDTTIDDLAAPDRTYAAAYPRMVLYYLAREVAGETLVNIGRAVQRDHSTVHHGWDKMSRRINASRSARIDVALLSAQLRNLSRIIGSSPDVYGRVYIEGDESIDILTPYGLRLDSEGRPLAIYVDGRPDPVLTWNRAAGVTVHRFLTNDHRAMAA